MDFDVGRLFIALVEIIIEVISMIFDWILSKLGFNEQQSERIKKWLAWITIVLFFFFLVWITITYS